MRTSDTGGKMWSNYLKFKRVKPPEMSEIAHCMSEMVCSTWDVMMVGGRGMIWSLLPPWHALQGSSFQMLLNHFGHGLQHLHVVGVTRRCLHHTLTCWWLMWWWCAADVLSTTSMLFQLLWDPTASISSKTESHDHEIKTRGRHSVGVTSCMLMRKLWVLIDQLQRVEDLTPNISTVNWRLCTCLLHPPPPRCLCDPVWWSPDCFGDSWSDGERHSLFQGNPVRCRQWVRGYGSQGVSLRVSKQQHLFWDKVTSFKLYMLVLTYALVNRQAKHPLEQTGTVCVFNIRKLLMSSTTLKQQTNIQGLEGRTNTVNKLCASIFSPDLKLTNKPRWKKICYSCCTKSLAEPQCSALLEWNLAKQDKT